MKATPRYTHTQPAAVLRHARAPMELGALLGTIPLRGSEELAGGPEWRRELRVSEQADGYTLEACLPGMDSHLVGVSVRNTILTLHLTPADRKSVV